MAAHDPLREEEFESRWEAAPAVALVIAGQLLLALLSRDQHWEIWGLPWWVWLVPIGAELPLLIALGWDRPRHRLEQIGLRRHAALVLLAVVGLADAFLLLTVVASLVSGQERSGGQLLLKGLTLWGTNVIAFGLWFWAIDRGGPARRLLADPPPPDFQFPQDDNPGLAAPGWHPRLFDYMYVSFTNSIAFSPTDTMPLTGRAKRAMLAESATSGITALLIVARAVNTFS